MRVVIIGGGFAGLSVARGLKDAPVEITLIDRRNFHLFQPLLYQVATGGLSPANIAVPLRSILSKQKNAGVLLDEAAGFDLDNKRVQLASGATVDFDVLVVATGSSYNYFGHTEWESRAPSLKTIEDALEIRARILKAFENAERVQDDAEVRALLTFVVVGGGPTGVELAGAIAEVARYTLQRDFRRIRPADARILLLEAMDRILPPYPESLSRKAHEALERLGVEVRTGTTVTAIDEGGAWVTRGGERERIDAANVIWAAGVVGSGLGRLLAEAAGIEPGRNGRVPVNPDLTLPGHPNVFVAGDMAYLEQDGEPLPAVAQVALQQGAHIARTIRARLEGELVEPFRYRDKGTMATIGRSAAVADLGRIKLSGFIGWLTWLLVHIVNLAQFENRILVMVQWAWNYFTHGRSARLITGPPKTDSRGEEGQT